MRHGPKHVSAAPGVQVVPGTVGAPAGAGGAGVEVFALAPLDVIQDVLAFELFFGHGADEN